MNSGRSKERAVPKKDQLKLEKGTNLSCDKISVCVYAKVNFCMSREKIVAWVWETRIACGVLSDFAYVD